MTRQEGMDARAGLEDAEPLKRRRLSTVLAGLSWRTASQIVFVAINLGLTPFLLHRLGLARYGLWALLNIYLGVLLNLDGGLGSSATRFFAVRVGVGDRRGCSRVLATLWLLSFAFVLPLAAVAIVVAPYLAGHLHASAELRAEATVLIRAFMPLVLLSALDGAVSSLVAAHHRWGYLSLTSVIGQGVYAVLAVVLTSEGHGLVGLVVASLAQELCILVLYFVGARGMYSWRECVPLPWPEIRALVSYASRVQVSLVASLVNFQTDAFIVSALLPLRFVALYTIGANFYLQLRALPLNATPPIAVTLSQTFGRSGLAATIGEFSRLQRGWVRTVSGYCVIGAVAGVVAIPRWLGPKEQLAGEVAAILLAGAAFGLLTSVMTNLTNAVNYPGIESRYGMVSMVTNLACTVPLAIAFGVLGVAAGTAIGQLFGSIYLQRLVPRRVSPDIPGFFGSLPLVPIVVVTVVTAALEVGCHFAAPYGVGGLLCCAVPAVIGLGLYAVLLNGLRPSMATAATFLRARGLLSPEEMAPPSSAGS